MKKLLFLTLLAVGCLNLFSQTGDTITKKTSSDEIRTIVGKVNSCGGYIGLSANYTEINHRQAILVGGRTGWIINHALTMGIGGYGFGDDSKYDKTLKKNANITGGYGGFFVEPIIFPRFPVHLSIPILIGAGGIAKSVNYYDFESEDWEEFYDDADVYAVVEAGAEIELNMLRFFRIALGASYRYTTPVNLQDVKHEALNGLNVGVTFKFGKF